MAAMNYQQVYEYVNSSGALEHRSAVAIATAATQILSEDPATAQHALRITWAQKALGDPNALAKKMAWGIMSNTTLQGAGDAMLDSDLQFVVNSLINSYLNV